MTSPSPRALRAYSSVGALAVVAALALSGTSTATAATGPTCLSGTCTVVFDLTGAPESFVVPQGVSSVTATVMAGSGGSEVRASDGVEYPTGAVGAGGTGGAVTGSVPVTGGQLITAVVGGVGADGVPNSTTGAAGGYGGGGAGGALTNGQPHNSGGAGGGGSFLFVDDELQIAAGGGGGGTSIEGGEAIAGGAGGSTGAGADGTANTTLRPNYSATGATTTAPGATATPDGTQAQYPGSAGSATPTTTPLALATAGAGAVATDGGRYGTAGGGGGGYFGGGGGASDFPGGWVGAGGGGSAFQAATVTGVAALAPHVGDGSVVVTFAQPVATTTTLAVSGSPTESSPVTLTATVSPASSTGTVVFTAGAVALGSAPVTGGVASLTVTLAAGDYSVVASYSGDATSSDSASQPLAVTVAAAPVAPPTTPTDPTVPTVPAPAAPASPAAPVAVPAAGPAAATPVATRSGDLAFTGQDTTPGLLAGAALLLSGLALQAVVLRRRRGTQAD